MKKLLIISLVVIGMVSCKKKENCEAGTGGELTIMAYLEHHGTKIPNQVDYPDTVYIKFDTQESAGTNPENYDTKFIGEPGEDHVHISGLKCGDYFLYAVGMDTSIHQKVSGGTKFSTDQNSGDVVVHIPVVE